MRVKWTRDEVILGLDVLFSTSISYLTENSLPIIELSNALRSMPIINGSIKNDLFRSPSEVHKQVLTFGWSLRKGENQVNVDPEFINTYNQFSENLSELHKIAITIRKYAKFNTMTPFGDPAENDHFPEGAILSHVHRNIETKYNQSCNEKLVECEICGIHPSKIYPDVCGKSILNLHHLISPSNLDPDQKIKATDFITVCPNCHQILHILRPWRSRDECSDILII